ncbi:MAG: hypothetical protein M3Z06_16090 [Actinomycetota bacterium]|nr:hypothetical protein [Actinomycetota bacterium]
MPASTPNAALRGRIELAIRLAAPVLDLVLAVGDRVSRLITRDDPTYVPARMQSEGESAPRGLPPRRR